MDKRYYTSTEVMDMFGLAPNNYTSFGKLCRKLRLPRMKIGKSILFPVRLFDRRLEVIESKKLKNFNI
jgi:hypothetical protein